MDEEDKLLSTSMLRGILIIGGLGIAGVVAYLWWKKQKSSEVVSAPKTVTIPISLPTIKKKKK